MKPAAGTEFGSMRQILNMTSTPKCRNASTCVFFLSKERCARGFRNLPHTSVGQFQKCGEKLRTVDQTSVLSFGDLRFCCRKSGYARQVSIFPRTSENRGKSECPKAETRQLSLEKQPLKRKNRLSAVPTDQAGRTVARPHQGLLYGRVRLWSIIFQVWGQRSSYIEKLICGR